MKKDYMKPEGTLVALCANENIATSGEPSGATDAFSISYQVGADGVKYIFDTQFVASNSDYEVVNRFADLLTCLKNGLDSTCYND